MKPQKMLLYGFITIMILRLIMVFTMGIMPQDAYYYFYSQHLSLSYFDHPPGVAVMLWFSTKILGEAVWSIKLTNVLVSCGTLWALYHLARQFLQRQNAQNAVFVLASTLLFTDVNIVVTPDVPLLLFWTLALLAIRKALTQTGIVYWLIAGLLAGLAFDCKYTALYLPIGLFGYLIMSKQHRKLLSSWSVYAFVAAFVVAILPVIVWNLENEMASFTFQSSDRLMSILEFRLRPKYFLGTLGHQVILLIPFLAIAIGTTYWKHIMKAFRMRKLPDDDTLFLLSFSLPLILVFLGISLVYWVKINWMIPLYVTAVILSVRYMRKLWLRWQMWVSVGMNLLLLIQILLYPINIKTDDTFWGWKMLANEVAQLKLEYPGYFIFSKDGYKTTAVLNFYLDEQVYAGNVIGEHALEYSITDDDLTILYGRNALFIDSQKIDAKSTSKYKPPKELATYFKYTTVLAPIILYNAQGRPLRKFEVVECRNYCGD